jgi:hypothetical protein
VYVVANQDRRAAFVIEKGPFSAGIRFANDGAHLRLFGLRDWFCAQLQDPMIREATKGGAGCVPHLRSASGPSRRRTAD